MTQRNDVYDLIGIGFGPSNLALAARLADSAATASLRRAFIERQSEFGWHRGMLLDDSRMQISFLKDLAMPRDPKSRFTFVNYLFEHGRLQDFVNLKQSYPTRIEFHDYLKWVAQAFDNEVAYGETVTSIEPVFDRRDANVVTHVCVRSADTWGRERERMGRALSVGIGGTPSIPEPFAPLATMQHAPIVHSSAYLSSIGGLLGDGTTRQRIAVVGGGQSAAEVFVDLTRRFPCVDATLIMRAAALRPADDSPFVNEIFNPGYTDVMYAQPDDARRATLQLFRDTNYSVVDRPLIEHIYALFYLQRVGRETRHRLLTHTSVDSARLVGREGEPRSIDLALRSGPNGGPFSERFDAVVLATGYQRNEHLTLLDGLTDALGEAPGRCTVTRDYRLRTDAHFQPRIYLQGCCEDTHGLSDTLLSVLACRADEIATSLIQPTGAQVQDHAYRASDGRNETSGHRAAVAL